MKTRKHSMVPAAACLLAVLMSGAAATGMAQAAPPSQGKKDQHQEGMKGMMGMQGMMAGPHHVLAMAYRDNLVTFARAVRGEVNRSKVVNLDLARPAVAEMRRSFDQIKAHHQGGMAMMGDMKSPMMDDKTKAKMSGMMQQMETHLAELNKHLTALESEVNASAPDPKKVSEHASEIVKHGGGMSSMPAKGKSGKTK